jgi:hypothetical protein
MENLIVSKRGRKTKYPYQTIAVNESFLVGEQQLAHAVKYNANQWAKNKQLEHRFEVRDGEESGNHYIIRVK